MPTAISAPTGRKVWTLAKLYAAVKDLPEVVPLVGLVGATLAAAGYTVYRAYSPAAEAVPTKELRHSMEAQCGSFGQDKVKPSIFHKVAEWRRDPKDQTLDVGVWPFHNKDWKFDHVTVPDPPQQDSHGGPAPVWPAEY